MGGRYRVAWSGALVVMYSLFLILLAICPRSPAATVRGSPLGTHYCRVRGGGGRGCLPGVVQGLEVDRLAAHPEQVRLALVPARARGSLVAAVA
jgi:hypothetical protein